MRNVRMDMLKYLCMRVYTYTFTIHYVVVWQDQELDFSHLDGNVFGNQFRCQL